MKPMLMLVFIKVLYLSLLGQETSHYFLENKSQNQSKRNASAEVVDVFFETTSFGGVTTKHAVLVKVSTPNIEEVFSMLIGKNDTLIYLVSTDGVDLGIIPIINSDSVFKIGTSNLPVGSEVFSTRITNNGFRVNFLGNNYPSNTPYVAGLGISGSGSIFMIEYFDGYESFVLEH